uniref:Secreted protein n=1 Tax=Physcomitrium patens TaxID=3218 RepID=A0A2K1IDF9_PHYPA|nr:hypothetical protein PHYPA_029466 [Physcomitrium patens]
MCVVAGCCVLGLRTTAAGFCGQPRDQRQARVGLTQWFAIWILHRKFIEASCNISLVQLWSLTPMQTCQQKGWKTTVEMEYYRSAIPLRVEDLD